MCICAELRSALSVLAEGSPTSMSTSAEQVSREAILSAIRPCMPSLKLLCIPTASSNLASYLLSDSNHVPSREEFSRGIGPSVVSALEAVFERKRMPVLVDCANKGHLEELVAARLTWEESLADELQAISRETDRPILQLREKDEVNPYLGSTARLNDQDKDIKFLYDSDDLYAVISTVLNKSCDMQPLTAPKPVLLVPSIGELIQRFHEMSCCNHHLGFDDTIGEVAARFNASRQEAGEQVLTYGTPNEVREYLKRGSAPSLRARLWRRSLCLCAEVCATDMARFTLLLSECNRVDLVIDEMVVNDVHATAEDPAYFVFEEVLIETCLAFFRDSSFSSDTDNAMLLPCGVFPFAGFSALLAPLCYCFEGSAALYSTAHAMFYRLWRHIHAVDNIEGSGVYLVAVFDAVMGQLHPLLVRHLQALGVNPSQIAFSWCATGFVGFLIPSQILILWDRLLGYMDLSLLPLFAVCVFLFKAEYLMQCVNESEVLIILKEGTKLRVIPMLQMLLFSGEEEALLSEDETAEDFDFSQL